VFLNPPYQLLNAWTNLYETWYVPHGSWALLNDELRKSLPSVCVPVLVFPLSLLGNGSVNTFLRQRTQVTMGDLLHASFCMPSVSYRTEVGNYFLPELLVLVYLIFLVLGPFLFFLILHTYFCLLPFHSVSSTYLLLLITLYSDPVLIFSPPAIPFAYAPFLLPPYHSLPSALSPVFLGAKGKVVLVLS
jgi:hypothetical protein